MSSPTARYLLGVDVGGTFTDVVLLDAETGATRIYKLPSTPTDPALGFLAGVDLALGEGPVPPEAVWRLVHGTTVATNAIIEGKLARTALLVTRGFRDILEIARQTRPDLFDLFCDKPAPLVPRDLCLEIGERIGPRGEVIELLAEADVEAAVATLLRENVEAVAVCFLHAYSHPEHERRAGAIMAQQCPDLPLSLSSDVLPEFREYRRASTTVINAGLLPVIRRYLDGVRAGLGQRGLSPTFHVMQSSGGVLTADAACAKPVYIVESGPAAGVVAAAHLGALAGHRDVIAFDMGGTTAKVSLVQDGQPRVSPEMEVGAASGGLSGFSSGSTSRGKGYPIGTRALDLVEIGAGGGSIAWIDGGGILRVGPRSAGADPGPACYGRGGAEPTVTDANLMLGRLNADHFLGGQMRLDADAARAAIARLGDALGLSFMETAAGIVENVTASMVRALHLVSTQRGYDPGAFTLVAFGGAGPLHANALAAQLGMRRVLIPRSPGVTSALGLLLSDVEHDLVVTRVQRCGELDYPSLNRLVADFAAEGRAILASEGVEDAQIHLARSLDLRYVGQSYELEIPLAAAALDADVEMALARQFHAEHRRAYGFAAPEEPIELVNLRVKAIGSLPRPRFERASSQRLVASASGQRPVFFDDGHVDCAIYNRYELGAGAQIAGPAVIEEFDSTVVVHPGYGATVDDYGNLVVARVE